MGVFNMQLNVSKLLKFNTVAVMLILWYKLGLWAVTVELSCLPYMLHCAIMCTGMHLDI